MRPADREESSDGTPALPQIPPRVGPFEIVRLLGRGGTAEVYLAKRPDVNPARRIVALKCLRGFFDDDTGIIKSFEREGEIARNLTHPNVVATYDTGTALDGTVFQAMEYLEGQPLSRIARSAEARNVRFPERIAARIAVEVLTGLHYVHTKRDAANAPLGIVHRDINPPNLFVCLDGSVKILDFGVAKCADKAEMTAAGIVKGKLAYMAPEQARQAEIDGRADVYSIGVVLWELLTGQRLWGDTPVGELLSTLLVRPPPNVRSVDPKISPTLDRLVTRAVAHDVAERFPTAAAMADAILAALASRGGIATRDEVARFVKTVEQLGDKDASHFNPDMEQIEPTLRDASGPTLIRPELAPSTPPEPIAANPNLMVNTATAFSSERPTEMDFADEVTIARPQMLALPPSLPTPPPSAPPRVSTSTRDRIHARGRRPTVALTAAVAAVAALVGMMGRQASQPEAGPTASAAPNVRPEVALVADPPAHAPAPPTDPSLAAPVPATEPAAAHDAGAKAEASH